MRRREGGGRLDRRQEPIPPAWHRLDEARTFGIVVERRADLGDADVERPVEIDRRVAPDLAADAVAVHHFARAFASSRST